jgi:hypothetical protein
MELWLRLVSGAGQRRYDDNGKTKLGFRIDLS